MARAPRLNNLVDNHNYMKFEYLLSERDATKLLAGLEESALKITSEVRNLCAYLRELRGDDCFCSSYSESILMRSLNKILNNVPTFPVSRPLSYGTTKNNLDQFDWFDAQLSRHKPSLRMANISIAPWNDLRFKCFVSDELKKDLCFLILSCASKAGAGSYLSDFVVKYSINYIKYFIAFSRLARDQCPFVCVSNDHTPSAMGFSKAAKSFGLYRVYLQHAFVTELFPPLDFDLSILFNKISADVYAAVSRPSGEVLIIPRYPVQGVTNKDLFYKKELVSNKVFVVFYLGGSNDKNTLFDAIKKLTRNPLVSKVAVKLHPNPRNHELKQDIIETWGRDALVESDVLEPHVAICGNSSVVLKLLAFGVRCFHLFALDTRKKDYYGFVNGGGALELDLDDLDRNFLDRWEEQIYVNSRAKYIEGPESDSYRRNVIRLDTILRKLLRPCGLSFAFISGSPNGAWGLPSSPDYGLSLSKTEIAYLNALVFCSRCPESIHFVQDGLKFLSVSERHGLLSRVYRYRHPHAITLMQAACRYDPAWEVRLFYKYHTEKLVGLKENLSWREDLEFLYRNDCALRHRETIATEILTYVASLGINAVVYALELLVKFGASFRRISIKCRLQLISALENHEYESLSSMLFTTVDHGVMYCHNLSRYGRVSETKMLVSSGSLISHHEVLSSYASSMQGEAKEDIRVSFPMWTK